MKSIEYQIPNYRAKTRIENFVCFERTCLACDTSFAISGNEDGGWNVRVIKKANNNKEKKQRAKEDFLFGGSFLIKF